MAQPERLEPASGEAPRAISDRYRRYVLGLLLVVYVFNFLDRQILTILLEPIKLEFALSDAQLVGPLAWHDEPAPVFRIFMEGNHARRECAHGPDEQPLQTEINQHGGHQRDNDGKGQNADRVIDHRGPQRHFLEHYFYFHIGLFG